MLKRAEDHLKKERDAIDKAAQRGMDPLATFWVEKPTKTAVLDKKVSVSTGETFAKVYDRLVDWGWLEVRHFNRRNWYRIHIGTVGDQPPTGGQ